MKATLAQAGLELRLTLRRGENLLVSLIIPIALLLFLSSTNVFAAASDRPVDYLVPASWRWQLCRHHLSVWVSRRPTSGITACSSDSAGRRSPDRSSSRPSCWRCWRSR